MLNNKVSLFESNLSCDVCPHWGFPLGSGWFQLWGRWVKVLHFTPLARLKMRRRKMAPFSVRQQCCKAVTANSQQSLGLWCILVQTPSPVTLDVLLLSHPHHTDAGQPAAFAFYCLQALKSRPPAQLCMMSVPIYNRGMGAREGFLLLYCHSFPALPSFIYWPLLDVLFVQ